MRFAIEVLRQFCFDHKLLDVYLTLKPNCSICFEPISTYSTALIESCFNYISSFGILQFGNPANTVGQKTDKFPSSSQPQTGVCYWRKKLLPYDFTSLKQRVKCFKHPEIKDVVSYENFDQLFDVHCLVESTHLHSIIKVRKGVLLSRVCFALDQIIWNHTVSWSIFECSLQKIIPMPSLKNWRNLTHSNLLGNIRDKFTIIP